MDELPIEKILKKKVLEDIERYEKELDTFRADRELREMLESLLTTLYSLRSSMMK